MSLLDHPTAQALLAGAEVSAVASCPRRLAGFLARYLPCFYRVEQHELAGVVLQGKLSGLQRKTAEPIAAQAGRPRKPVQHFVGAGRWDDESVMAELRRHVDDDLGSAFGKPSAQRRGVAYIGDALIGLWPGSELAVERGLGVRFERGAENLGAKPFQPQREP